MVLPEIRKRLATIALVLAAATAPRCATEGLTPIADPGRRVQAPGVSVLPPRGDGWAQLPVSPAEGVPPGATLIRFAKRLPQPRVRAGWLTYTAVFAVDLGTNEMRDAREFLAHFKREFQGGEGAARYAINVLSTERYPTGLTPPALDDEIEPFLRSVIFTSSRPVAIPGG
jgi:hypothetical protein